MREKAMSVRLVASPWMDARSQRENGRLRIPMRARLYFDVKNSRRIVLKNSGDDIALEVRLARKEDLAVLIAQVKSGEVSSSQADITAFVTTTTKNRFLGNKNKDDSLYITDRLDALKIGADPEFCLVDPATSKFQYAAYVQGLTVQGELGQDGPLAEVRPKPEKSSSKLVENIRKIFHDNQNSIRNYNWVGGATYHSEKHPEDRVLSIGGHIHIGDPPLLHNDRRHAAYTRVIQILDETIALPLVKVDTPNARHRRNTGDRYGRWGDQRPQVGRFEWRVPSGFWLVHPELAEAILGTTKAVSESCYEKMAEADFDMNYLSAPLNQKGFLKEWGALAKDKAEKLINDSNPEVIDSDLISRAEEKLKSLPNYKQYQGEIDSFIDIVNLSPKDQKRISLDLKRNWLEKGSLFSKG